jgi:hypothetical protein
MAIEIKHNNLLLAIIIPDNYDEPGIHFFTPDNLSQQLGFLNHPKGKLIEPHTHNKVVREIQYSQEVLFIKKGKVRVDFFDPEKNYLESRVLEAGDTILLASGGHGFEVIEDTIMIEVKQGPYSGDMDKTRFNPNPISSLRIVKST